MTPHSALLRSGYYVQGEVNAALFAQADDSNSPALLARAFGFSVRGGHRWDNKALFVSLEAEFWSAPVLDGKRQIAMATNIGFGGEYLAAGGLLRTSLAFGPSILTIPTSVDSGASVGFFVDLRPLGLRFELGGGWLFGVDPLSLTLLMPELLGHPAGRARIPNFRVPGALVMMRMARSTSASSVAGASAGVRLLVASLCTLSMLLPSSHAAAYSLGSGVTTSCHEVLTFEALVEIVGAVDTSGIQLPEDDSWRKVAHDVAVALAATNPSAPQPQEMTEQQQFALWSVIVGVRAPDVEGHSVSDLATLRIIQADPTPEGQYLHALRGTADDGIAGEIAAIAGTKQQLINALNEARAARSMPALIDVPFSLDFYGKTQVTVLRMAYLLGRAAHTVQDAHAHMLRSDDGLTVLHVSNYLEAIEGSLNERRDGMAHSVSFDDCTGPTDTLTTRAKSATLGLARASRAYVAGDDVLLQKGLSACAADEVDLTSCGWITYNPPCEAAFDAADQAAQDAACCSATNDYCGTKWLPLFREKQSKPYLQEIFGCNVAVPQRPSGALTFAFACLLAVLWGRRRARLRVATWFTLGLLLARGGLVRAAPPEPIGSYIAPPLERSGDRLAKHFFVELLGHLSLLNDAPDVSLINLTLGYAIRGGYRFERWGLVVAVERNYWQPTEFPGPLAQGTLNIGVGAEYRYAGGFARSSLLIGPSILMFDATYHSAGHTGIYLDLRPIGLRYEVVEHLAIAFDPLTVAYVQPVISATHSIRQLEYRTLLGVEYSF